MRPIAYQIEHSSTKASSDSAVAVLTEQNSNNSQSTTAMTNDVHVQPQRHHNHQPHQQEQHQHQHQHQAHRKAEPSSSYHHNDHGHHHHRGNDLSEEHHESSTSTSTPATSLPVNTVTTTKEKSIKHYIPKYLRKYIHPGPDIYGDFCITTHVQYPKLIAQCMMEGFLPMAYSNEMILPKLHNIRSIIPLKVTVPIKTVQTGTATSSTINSRHHQHPGEPRPQVQQQQYLHISKNTRKRSKHYYMTVNTAFDTVVEYCQQQHGTNHCWLYPSLIHIFRAIHHATIHHPQGYITTTQTPTTTSIHTNQHQQQQQQQQVSIRLYTIEAWNNDTHEFAAGEIGYTIGNTIYTSLTGCSVEDSAGSVQLASLGALLLYHQFQVWDLGMDMPYKQTLGAQLMKRPNFVELVQALRILPDPLPSSQQQQQPRQQSSNDSQSVSSVLSVWPIQQITQPINCRDMIDTIVNTTKCKATTTTGRSTSNTSITMPLQKEPLVSTKINSTGNAMNTKIDDTTDNTALDAIHSDGTRHPMNKKQLKELKKGQKMKRNVTDSITSTVTTTNATHR
jgi:Leu/Phe-tRNA-protein transferase